MARTREGRPRLSVVRARPEHAEEVAKNLLPKEYEEWLFLRQALGSGGATVADDLRRGIINGVEAWYAFDALGPVALFGVTAFAGGGAAPWLRVAGGIGRHRRQTVRLGRLVLKRWLARFGVLANLAWADYPDGLRYLRCLTRRGGKGRNKTAAALHTRVNGKFLVFYIIGADAPRRPEHVSPDGGRMGPEQGGAACAIR